MNTQSIGLPPPSPATRQVGVSITGSPLELPRYISNASSEAQNLHEKLSNALTLYQTHLEHDIEFVSNEIKAITENTEQQEMLIKLRDAIQSRYTTLQLRLARVKALLEVM